MRSLVRIHHNRSVDYKGVNYLQYKGKLRFINRRNILIQYLTKDGLFSYCDILKIQYDGNTTKLVGTYSGVSHENKPVGGKVYLVKTKNGTFENEEAKFIYNTSDEYNKLLTDNPDFKKHFRNELNTNNSLTLKNSSSVSKKLNGYYSMYYLSVRKSNLIIRKVPFYISNNGNLKGVFKYNIPIQGKVNFIGDLLYLTIDTDRDEYLGIITFFARDYLGDGGLIGIYNTNTADGVPIARRVVFTKDVSLKNHFGGQQIFIGSEDFHDLNKRFNGLGNYLTGQLDNYIIAPKQVDIREFKKRINYETHFFNSAILNATQKQYKEAIEAFDLAIRHGYNDIEKINDEMENGVFQPIKSEIKEVLRLINQ